MCDFSYNERHFFGIVGLAGFILAHIWPVLVILMIIWIVQRAEEIDGKDEEKQVSEKAVCLFMAVAVIPLCILGMFSYHTAKEALRENIHHGNEAALAQIENKTEKALEMIRIDFLETAVSPVTQRMINSAYDEIPYPELRDF